MAPACDPAVPETPAPAADARPAVESVPWGVRVAAAWSWRIVAVIAAAALIGYALIRLHIVVVPVLIALLLAAALQPIVVWVERHRVPHTLAAALVLVGGIVIVVGGLAIVIKAFVNGLPDLSSRISHATDDLQHWLVHGPLKLSDKQVSDYVDNAKDFASKNRDTLTSGACRHRGHPRPRPDRCAHHAVHAVLLPPRRPQDLDLDRPAAPPRRPRTDGRRGGAGLRARW